MASDFVPSNGTVGYQLLRLNKESLLRILMTDEARDHIRDLGRPIALDYLAAIG